MTRVQLWGPVVLIMALIFFLSSLSDPGAPPGGLSDKAAHALIYAALGGSFLRALAGGRSRRMTLTMVLAAAVLTTAYGATDEFHQSFVPDRTPDVLDLAADACGGLAGALAVSAVWRGWRRVRGSENRP